MKQDGIPQAVLARVEKQLHHDENLLWVGFPDWNHLPDSQGRKSHQMIRGLLAYWLGLAGIAYLASQRLLSPPMLVALVILIIAVSIIATVLERVFSAHEKIYALTDQRALVFSGRRMQSYDSQDIQFIERVMHADGTGDILFKHSMQRQMMMLGTVVAEQAVPQSSGFFGIKNPKQVEAMMLEIFRAQADTRSAAEQYVPESVSLQLERVGQV